MSSTRVFIAKLLIVTGCLANVDKHGLFENAIATSNELTKIRGYLKVATELASVNDRSNSKLELDHESVKMTRKPSHVRLCLVRKDFQYKRAGWKLHDCLTTNLPKTQTNLQDGRSQLMKSSYVYDDAYLPIPVQLEDASEWRIVAIVSSIDEANEDDQVYWLELPVIFPNDNVVHKFQMKSQEVTKVDIFVTLSLHCSTKRYGPICTIECAPHTSRHICNEVTGELKCAGTWTGENCDDNVFLGRNQASEFIKLRRKRANTWHRFEEVNPGNIEQECEEEICSREEAREAFEDDALTESYWRRYTDTNQCQPNPCYAGRTARCEDLVGDYNCHCLPGYKGKNCQKEIDVCESGPCKNGATCQRHSPTSYGCLCSPGFRGSTCNIDIDECVTGDGNYPCGLHGTCQDGINSFTCVCDNGYTGSSCEQEINECDSNPCQNGGNCTNNVAFYSCSCPEDYEGVNCENRISPCVSGPCLNGGECNLNSDYTFDCSCTSLFAGPLCQHDANGPCASLPCKNGGSCYVNSSIAEELPSSVGNFSNLEQGFNCVCDIGFGGETCERKIPPCELTKNPCPDNATCINLERQYLCACPAGYTGDSCNVVGEGDPALNQLRCDDDPCLNEGRCLFHHNTTTCVCRPGYNGTHCENEINFCSSSPCMNGGICLPVPNNFICSCLQGFNGAKCEQDIDECAFGTICQNGATCENTKGSFACLCAPYFTGRICNTPYDPCSVAPCKNGGSCVNGSLGYECNCLEGYGGQNCSDTVDPCTHVTNPCMHDALCEPRHDDATKANCTCTEGYFGRFCKHEIDHCVSWNVTADGHLVGPVEMNPSPCGENGDCVSELIGYRCHCRKGYTGKKCEREFHPPIFNCTSENCPCSNKLVQQVQYHGNTSSAECQYKHYEKGFCKPSVCLTPYCANTSNQYHCTWKSTCLEIYLRNPTELPNANCLMLVMELNHTMLPKNMTTGDFCGKIRQLSSYSHFLGHVTLHCARNNINYENTSLAVAIDSVDSQQNAFLLATDMYQTLQLKLRNETNTDPASEDLDPSFSSLLSVEIILPITPVRLPHSSRAHHARIEIVVPLILLLIVGIVFVIYFLFRRRRKNSLKITYVPNSHDHIDIIPGIERGTNGAVVASTSSDYCSSSPEHKKENGFLNPLFSERANCNGSTSPARGRNNTYVQIPPASPNISKGTMSSSKPVEENTVAFHMLSQGYAVAENQYEDMRAATLPYDAALPQGNSDTPYAFARESGSSTPTLEKNRLMVNASPSKASQLSASPSHPYAEINFKHSLSEDQHDSTLKVTLYDTASDSPSQQGDATHSSETDRVGPLIEDDWATEVISKSKEPTPSNQMLDLDSDDSIKDTPLVNNANNNGQSGGTSPPTDGREHYQMPSFFPQHDDLFFPAEKSQPPINDIYSAPRKANPIG